MWICLRFSQMVCGKPSRCFLSVVWLLVCELGSSRSPPEKFTRQPKMKVLVKWTDFTKSSWPGSLRNYTNLWIFSQQKLKMQFMHRLYTSYQDGRRCDFRTTLCIGTEKAGIVYFLCATFGSMPGFDDCTAPLAYEWEMQCQVSSSFKSLIYKFNNSSIAASDRRLYRAYVFLLQVSKCSELW